MLEALVTGSTGFIGSHLVEALLDKGINVRCLLRENKSNEKYLKKLDVQKFYVKNYSVEELNKSKALENIDYIFHTAGVTKGINFNDFKDGNYKPTFALVQSLLEQKNSDLKRFVYLSSTAVAGPSQSLNEPIVNPEHVSFIEHYGASKYLGELVVKNSRLPYTILRPGGVYGPRDIDYFNLFKSIRKRINPFFGNKNKYHAIIHVNDLVKGIIDATFSDKSAYQYYYLCNDEPVSWEALQSEIVNAVGKKVFTINFPSFFMDMATFFGELYSKISKKHSLLNKQKLMLSKPDYWIFSNEKAKKDFNFKPSISLEEGVKATYNWYLQNYWF
ncbi:MAG: NAD(P)-dependent oxidoreductase [Nanoarchaeota archaeon]|nr:NAD(P)-dependent oxidoreductase [Nanoarchaeota archaeon]